MEVSWAPILAKLGLRAAPAPDLNGLREVYRVWCDSVPFDNVRKMIAVRDRGPMPGGAAADFFESWLAHGTGGTCWPSSNALFSLFAALGFQVQRVAGSMRDIGAPNHGSAVVTVEGRQWLADSSMLCNEPLPLDGAGFRMDDPLFAAEVEPDPGGHVVWVRLPPSAEHMPCRIFPDAVTHGFYADRYEESRARSPFNQRLFARRNGPGGVTALVGNMRFHRSAAGIEVDVLSPDRLCEALCTDIGVSGEMVETWSRAGCLAASMERGSTPPPIAGLPPSKRGRAE